MRTNEPLLAVLDGQFYLHRALSTSPFASVFLATHTSGIEVVVKFVWSGAQFFDELARLYACDDSPYTCGCIFNYPPKSVSGDFPPLDRPFSEMANLRRAREPKETQERDWSQVGVLILEYVQGDSLLAHLERGDDLERLDMLLELCGALEELSARGISHGDLSPDNVLLESETEEIKLVGLGQVIGKRVPFSETRDLDTLATREPVLRDDLYQLCLAYLPTLDRPGRKLNSIRRRCLAPTAEKHPDLEEIKGGLKDLRRKRSPKQSLEILFGFFRPAHLAVWLCLVLLSTVLISHLQGSRHSLPKKRNQILAKTDWETSRKVEALRELLEGMRGEKEERYQDIVIRDIAELNLELEGVKRMEGLDASRPIAVLAFFHAPAVIGRRDVFQLGDWIQVDGKQGFLSRIEFNRIRIERHQAFSWHYFEEPAFPFGKAYGNNAVLVWQNENNLTRLLQGIAELRGFSFSNRNQPPYPPRSDNAQPEPSKETPRGDGSFAGIFVSPSTEAFLQQLRSYIDFTLEDNQLVLNQFRDPIPVYFQMASIEYKGVDIAWFQQWLSQKLGYRVEIDPGLEGATLSINAFNITWQETLERLNLRWTVVTKDQEKIIVLLPSSDPSLMN